MAQQRTNSSQDKPDYIQLVFSGTQNIGTSATVPAFDTTQLSSGTKLTRSATGTVLIGAGVSRVKLSYTLMAENTGAATYIYARARRNSAEIGQVIDTAAGFKSVADSRIIPVVQGDTISIVIDSGGGTLTFGPGRNQVMTVEVVE